MVLTISEKIRLLLRRRHKTVAWLAEAMGFSRQYVTTKLRKNDFSVAELQLIAEKMGYDFEAVFIDWENGERF